MEDSLLSSQGNYGAAKYPEPPYQQYSPSPLPSVPSASPYNAPPPIIVQNQITYEPIVFGSAPVICRCPRCSYVGATEVKSPTLFCARLICLLSAFSGLWCLTAFCCIHIGNKEKHHEHRCRNCSELIANT